MGKRITISGICWATAQNRLGMRSRRRNITSLPGKGAQRWTPGGTTTINPPIIFSGRALRCVRAVTQRRPSSTSAILSTGPRSIGMTFRKSIFAVSLPDLVVLDVSAQQRHQQHCLFIEALGHLGLGNVSACQQRMQQLLQINPAHDKAHLIRHALQSGIFPEPQWAGSARLNPTVPCVSLIEESL